MSIIFPQGATIMLKKTEVEILGERFVELGQALQSNATIDELTKLAMACGLRLQVRIVPEGGADDEQE
ncbi:hypothetical protein [Pseudomonas typographi]|uniref:hypothetical protein n=1 Tax=Pseudomonas typographi TaxID=2715964 RepID=UPI00168A22AC|nr:hypothetical protein [Pseudomonas typographi]MBD1589626.1 hypothetical protein [Pseudomonas typographi]